MDAAKPVPHILCEIFWSDGRTGCVCSKCQRLFYFTTGNVIPYTLIERSSSHDTLGMVLCTDWSHTGTLAALVKAPFYATVSLPRFFVIGCEIDASSARSPVTEWLLY